MDWKGSLESDRFLGFVCTALGSLLVIGMFASLYYYYFLDTDFYLFDRFTGTLVTYIMIGFGFWVYWKKKSRVGLILSALFLVWAIYIQFFRSVRILWFIESLGIVVLPWTVFMLYEGISLLRKKK
jgi:hypothetical protein